MQKRYLEEYDGDTFIAVFKQILQQHLVPVLRVVKAVKHPFLQQRLPIPLYISVEEARKPLLQHRVNMIHHLT